jgi:DNA-binding response OmpR family regulator
MAKLVAPIADGTIERASIMAPTPTSSANRRVMAGVFLCDTVAKAIPHTTIHDTCATRPATVGMKRGMPATPKPLSTWLPSVAKGPDQSLWRTPNPMIAPPVAAAAINPARTPARIREENTEGKEAELPRALKRLARFARSGLHWKMSFKCEEQLSASANGSIIVTKMTTQPTYRTAGILVVEDAPDVLNVLDRTLSDNGYIVNTATDGEAGLAAALDLRPDLLILDIGLPLKDGYQVARELRARGYTAPVLMLTARDTVSDKVEGLDAGADDYLAKPFSYDELLARVRALLRRSALRADQSMIKVADLVIDPFSRDVRRGNREINLTQKEYALLEYLARHAGRPVTREQISQQVWKQDFDPTTNIVDVYINYVRKKVDVDGEASLVQTVRGVGYMLHG